MHFRYTLALPLATMLFDVLELLNDIGRVSPKRPLQRKKIFQYCTHLAGQVTYNFHLSCKHKHLSFKSVCNKEHKGVICNMTSSSYSSQNTHPTG